MPRIKVLITVLTYPLPSRSYEELVCTAGILEDGNWIRIYPVPLSFLLGQRSSGKMESFKYSWMEIELKKRTDDFRPESFSPQHYDFRDLILHGRIETKNNWHVRKKYCLKNVYTNFEQLIKESKEPTNKSLATFKPYSIEKLDIENDDREWKSEWLALRKQPDLFIQNKDPEKIIRKLPYKFYYCFKDETGKSRRLMIEDWEIGQLYWNCLRSTAGNEEEALKKVRQRYEEEFINKKDIHFFLGTIKKNHVKRYKNPFVIIGVFYPKKESQLNLFD